MLRGTPVGRHCILVLRDGRTIIDWGNGLFQDIHNGAFFPADGLAVGHTALDADLLTLQRAGLIDTFDENLAYVPALPDLPWQPIP